MSSASLKPSPELRPALALVFAARALAAAAFAALALGVAVSAQQNAPAPPAPNAAVQQAAPAQANQTGTPAAAQPSTEQNPPPAPPSSPAAAPHSSAASAKPAAQEQGITEEEVKQMLVGKELYLRGGYLDDTLTFNEHGKLIGHSAQGSYTLCGVEIDKVRLTKHKLELEGARYGLHFLGALPYEDPTKAVDRVRITPKKKVLRITIDRELVVKAKVKKEKGKQLEAATKPAAPAPATAAAGAPAVPAPPVPTSAPENSAAAPASASAPAATENASTNLSASAPGNASANPSSAPASSAPAPTEAASGQAPAGAQPEEPDTDEAQKEIAAAPPEERPADPNSVTATTSPAHAAQVLKDALDNVFSVGLDERMMAAMPDFWKLYYQAAAAHTDFRPADPGVLRQNTVDAKARLLTTFEPASNEFAQSNGVAGMALYHAVIGVDGKPDEIAVARPIGFGLDESAVEAIRKAQFQPAVKDGKPVPVLLDLVVQFRIYSKRTNVTDAPEQAQKPAEPILPGPYSVDHPQQAQQ
ncbi:MAG TPA: energy transducer TonB [Terracidiphilus sp.]|nr:energy transducer TonB [Terracidiphilus sp.]